MDPMLDNLTATGPHPDIADKLDLYGRLLGSWDIDNRYFDESAGAWQETVLTWHFGRILDGLGVQDVLRSERGSGTTVRVYDRQLGGWRVTWFGPVRADFASLVGRPHDDGIHQDGHGSDGRPLRWNFSDLRPDSFRWTGYISDDEGVTWRLEQEMHARRRAPDATAMVLPAVP
jgi:hypothetical protein